MRPRTHVLLILLTAAAALGVGFLAHRWQIARAVTPHLGEVVLDALNVSLADGDGHMHSVAEWRGKVLLLNFWATWCPPCREEIPLLNALQSRWSAQGAQIIGVALDEAGAVREFTRQTPLAYPSLIGGDDGAKLAERLGNRLGVLPFTVVIDATGKVAGQHLGEMHAQDAEDLLRPLLETQGGGNSR
jgi:thiol-disulfide isomerase/thioredoxin